MRAAFPVVFALFVSLALPAANAAAEDKDDGNDDGCQNVSLSTATSPITGNAILCANEQGMKGKIVAHNLISGSAYTVWFVYFNDPSACKVANQCTGADLTNPATDPVGVFGRFSSAVADENGDAVFKGAVSGFTPRAGSQTWLTMFVHGDASSDPKARARQLLTPETPALGAPGEGVTTRKGFPAANAIFNF